MLLNSLQPLRACKLSQDCVLLEKEQKRKKWSENSSQLWTAFSERHEWSWLTQQIFNSITYAALCPAAFDFSSSESLSKHTGSFHLLCDHFGLVANAGRNPTHTSVRLAGTELTGGEMQGNPILENEFGRDLEGEQSCSSFPWNPVVLPSREEVKWLCYHIPRPDLVI